MLLPWSASWLETLKRRRYLSYMVFERTTTMMPRNSSRQSPNEMEAYNALITLIPSYVLKQQQGKKCGASARIEFRPRQDFSGSGNLNFSSTPAEAKGLSSVGAP
jgi:hypothetical protein